MPTLEAQGIAGRWMFTGNPATNDRDWVRFTIGDVLADDQLVSDEMIAATVADSGSRSTAAIRLCEHLAARFARQADETVNDGAGNSRHKALSQRATAFLRLATQLRATGTIATTAMPYAGGISIGDKTIRENNADRVAPAFTVGMSDYK